MTFILRPLAERPVALLWSSYMSATVARELFRVALVWTAVGLIGGAAGYIAALESAAGFLVSLIGGVWTERWDQRRTLLGSVGARALIVLLLPLSAMLAGGPSIVLLCLVAVALAGLGAIYEPALQSSLPRMAAAERLHATNALLDASRRIARIAGPGLVGLIVAVFADIHLFTVAAALFALAALPMPGLRMALPARPLDAAAPAAWRRRMLDAMAGGWREARAHPLMRFTLLTMGLNNALWTIVYGIGLALIIKDLAPGDAGAYGVAIAFWGLGNLAANLCMGAVSDAWRVRVMFSGRLVVGAGFAAMGVAPSELLLLAATAFAGLGGPMTQVPFLTILQTDFNPDAIARIYRLHLTLDYASIFVCLLAAPVAIELVGAHAMVSAAGAIIVLLGIAGLWRFGAAHAPRHAGGSP